MPVGMGFLEAFAVASEVDTVRTSAGMGIVAADRHTEIGTGSVGA